MVEKSPTDSNQQPNRRLSDFTTQVGALEKCEEGISKILSTDVKDRWSEAGGKIETIPEAKTAQLGDKQRRKWFKRSLGQIMKIRAGDFGVLVGGVQWNCMEFCLKFFVFCLLDWCVFQKER